MGQLYENARQVATSEEPGILTKECQSDSAPHQAQDKMFVAYDSPRQSRHLVTASIKFKTSRTFLQNLFPAESFMFESPATVAYASFKSTTLGNMSWLGGGGYNHFGLHIHGVMYKKRDGSVVDVSYLPVLFEDLADPIITGRDEIGIPKVYCELDIQRQESSYRAQAS
jgi:hypothetical protein